MALINGFPVSGSGKLENALNEHIRNKNNPHEIKAEDIGAIKSEKIGQPNGIAELDSNGKVLTAQLPSMNYEPAGSVAPLSQKITDHENNNTIHITAAERTTWNNKANSTHTHSDYLPLEGGTLTGDLRIKGSGNYGIKINLGDEDYVCISEPTDDNLEIKANNINFVVTGDVTKNGSAIGGGSYVTAGQKSGTTLGSYATAEGEEVTASGVNSHAEGYYTIASASQSHAEGNSTTASGAFSHAEGRNTQATKVADHAEGQGSIASGITSHAEGNETNASGENSHAEGNETKALGKNSHAEGWGTQSINISDHAEGGHSVASGSYSHAEGSNTTASGNTSHSEGNNTTASGDSSHSEGYLTTASGYCAHSEGSSTEASGIDSHAGGTGSVASKFGSFAHGKFAFSGANYQTVIGRYNVKSTNESDIFIVGDGTDESSRINRFRLGVGGSYIMGGYNTGGADYAEMFEWQDGNPENQDRAGLFVTLDGNKIKIATPEDDFILGVVSGSPSVVGDVYDDQWKGMYMTDIFGRPIYEMRDFPAETRTIVKPDGTEETREIIPAQTKSVPKLNPDYNNKEEYLPRSKRPEWDAVGMMGKLVVIDDGSCEVNGWCKVGECGKGTKSETRTHYRVMERLDDNHIQILIL